MFLRLGINELCDSRNPVKTLIDINDEDDIVQHSRLVLRCHVEVCSQNHASLAYIDDGVGNLWPPCAQLLGHACHMLDELLAALVALERRKGVDEGLVSPANPEAGSITGQHAFGVESVGV